MNPIPVIQIPEEEHGSIVRDSCNDIVEDLDRLREEIDQAIRSASDISDVHALKAAAEKIHRMVPQVERLYRNFKLLPRMSRKRPDVRDKLNEIYPLLDEACALFQNKSQELEHNEVPCEEEHNNVN
ncbi:hypothetical protein B0I35DRAFT_159041 [Stachybotrys elegans]|uniref:Uncharacterized protein n=1 Tax=Stachybotrys elegans TaxID=80388 RepID=A0A8K0T0D0_9HYPO|nr:hypothetical protein B0I35DRAFT_159041 [Stachybotrys elegans]